MKPEEHANLRDIVLRMGEAWKDHRGKEASPNLRDVGAVGKIEIRKEMPPVDKTALQAVLAIHTYFAATKQPMDAVDFAHPWIKSGQFNRSEVMNQWMEKRSGKSNADRLGDFIEAMDIEAPSIAVDVTKEESRAEILLRMHIDTTPPQSGTTVH